jgi:Family of unknown function (DUF5706)
VIAIEERNKQTFQPSVDRLEFLWNQQRYIFENIRLADAKASFVLTISAALLSASLSPTARISLHLSSAMTIRNLGALIVTVVGFGCLVSSVLYSVWSIKPRLRSESETQASPVSWVNVARYADLQRFREANRTLTEESGADDLCGQVFYMSCICVRKHHLISTAIILAVAGGFCIGLALALK